VRPQVLSSAQEKDSYTGVQRNVLTTTTTTNHHRKLLKCLSTGIHLCFHPYKGMLLSNKKELTTETHNCMHDPKTPNKGKKLDTEYILCGFA
jgi:hypothetical protein